MIDIRNWTMDKIMMLPKHVFGRIWPVITSSPIGTSSVEQWLIPAHVPDNLVIWELLVHGHMTSVFHSYFKLALGDQAPADDTAFDILQRVFPLDIGPSTSEGGISIGTSNPHYLDIKIPVKTGGRRFVVQAANAHASLGMDFGLTIMISSIPASVPECLNYQ